MKNLFEHTSSPWIRYSSYEYRTAEDGTLYIVVSADAKPEMYNPMKDAESVLRLCNHFPGKQIILPIFRCHGKSPQ